MKTIETKPGVTLGFIKCPDGYEIGKLSEITEEQAKELVASFLQNGFVVYRDYCPKAPSVLNGYFSAFSSLKTSAECVGIEEKDFDKYLVVRV